MGERRRFTAQEKLECVQRELKQRRNVYPRLVSENRMSKAMADQQLALMEDIVADFVELAAGERMI